MSNNDDLNDYVLNAEEEKGHYDKGRQRELR